jgi:hypothetical protein
MISIANLKFISIEKASALAATFMQTFEIIDQTFALFLI